MKAKLHRGIVLAMLAFLSSCVVAPAHDYDEHYYHSNIGVNIGAYPSLSVVPGYPVYYAPGLSLNFFFYDGLYWLYHDDRWYSSHWYNGPWGGVGINMVPRVILQVPVRYYRKPPHYFYGWRPDASPRWGERWGRDWESRRGDWRRPPERDYREGAPRPDYQRDYSGPRYPQQLQRQREISREHYRYEPRDPEVRRQFERDGKWDATPQHRKERDGGRR